MELQLFALALVLIVGGAAVIAFTVVSGADAVNVNITNNTVYVSFANLTVINFTTTLIYLGWYNQTHIASSYSCLYAYSVSECHKIEIDVFEGTELKYTAVFDPASNPESMCEQVSGLCSGLALFNVSGFGEPARIMVKDLTEGKEEGPLVFEFPYKGPELTGYAQYVPLIVALGLLFGIPGRLSMKNVGIGLFLYGMLAPVITVLGANIKNIMLVSALSIIIGIILIWMSNQ